MKKLMTMIFIIFVMTSYTHNKEDAEKILKAQGFTDVSIHGYSFFGCSKEDTVRTKFRACMGAYSMCNWSIVRWTSV